MANKYANFSKAGNAPKNPNERKKFSRGKKTFKEIRIKPGIQDNDLTTKVKQINKFLEKGLKVRITLSIRGRQNKFKTEHLDVIFNKIKEGLVGGTMEGSTKAAGNNYMKWVNPASQKGKQ